MKRLGDYLGLGLVLVALTAGSILAYLAYQLSPVGSASGVAAAPTALPGGQVAELGGGDRSMGRLAFRSQCQECHIQGRQSFDMATRERTTLIQTRVRAGAGDMPAFSAERLPEETLRHIMAYVSTPAEPEAKSAPVRVRGVNLEILQASGQPGQRPTVRFLAKDDQGKAFAPTEMSTLALTVGGPTTDYRWSRREDARAAARVQPDGSAEYTFNAVIPEDATGTFAVGVEGAFDNPPAAPGTPAVREFGYNAIRYFAVTDPQPVPHPTIVKTENCNQCHGAMSAHGGGRNNTELCVMCHTVTQTDEDKRLTAGGLQPPESVLFRNFIHRIHTGEDLQQPFVVFGGAPANPQPANLAAVDPFPKDRANCALCHEPGTFNISSALEAKAPMTVTSQNQVVRQLGPITSSCTGCHDGARTLAHAAAQTTSQGVETCGTCHGAGRPFSVSSVHRIASKPS